MDPEEQDLAAIPGFDLCVNGPRKEIDRLMKVVELAGKVVCSWCGEQGERDPVAMVKHMVHCEKRKDVMSAVVAESLCWRSAARDVVARYTRWHESTPEYDSAEIATLAELLKIPAVEVGSPSEGADK